MQQSPYTPGAVTSWLPGREGTLARIADRLERTAALGRQAERPLIEVAPRGLGKTSLLREAQRRADARGMLTVWVSAGSATGLDRDIVTAVGRRTESWPAAARRRLGRRVRDVTVTVGIPGAAQVSSTVRPSGSATSRPPFEEFLRTAVEQARHQHHPAVVLFVDEIQDGDRAGLRTLAFAWQHLQSEVGRDPVPLAIVGAGLPDSARSLTHAASYTERWEFEGLDRLDPAATAVALAGPAQALGVGWDPVALQTAVAITQGYPYIVQLLGDRVWTLAGRPDPGSRIDVRLVHAADSAAKAELTTLYRGRWERATPAERRLLAAMASFGDGPSRRAQIAHRMGVHSDELGVPRANLIAKGIIAEAGHGELIFTVPGFARFVLDETGAAAEPDWAAVIAAAGYPDVRSAPRWPAVLALLHDSWQRGLDPTRLVAGVLAQRPADPLRALQAPLEQ